MNSADLILWLGDGDHGHLGIWASGNLEMLMMNDDEDNWLTYSITDVSTDFTAFSLIANLTRRFSAMSIISFTSPSVPSGKAP